MKYLTFIRHSESYRESPPPQALMEAMGTFVEKSLKEQPMATLAGAAVIGFVLGALWKK